MTLFPFIVSGLIAGAFGILGALICLRASRMLREHKVECSAQIEQLRRGIAVLELQLPRPGIGRREMQLIARISTVLGQ